MSKDETHPYNLEPVGSIPEGTCLLIVGTAPPPRFSLLRVAGSGLKNRDVDFYYGSSDNQMWRPILEELYGVKFFCSSRDDPREAMRSFLSRHKMWMRDVLQVYRRKEGTETRSRDGDIEWRNYTKFAPIFARHRSIDTVVFTGERAEKWTGEQLEKEGLIERGNFASAIRGEAKGKKRTIPRSAAITLWVDSEQRQIDFFTLPSPSAGNWMTYTEEQKIQWYGNVLCKRCPPIVSPRTATIR
jgi:G:T/U-mismatch repair DNA glycosylase